ncbi:hypothetical protein EPI10_027659 [Gossypium australe]|uniref:Uncharacterized protein n=1 Tax=Gossypium australe TaxID=47621 RepID=A0A5B6UZN7_9ROSI|nr:hypothetical protein EPI10_027659 [Gossypium australe]
MSDNTRADALSKLVSSIVIEQMGKIMLEHREIPSYDALQGIKDYSDKKELEKLQREVARILTATTVMPDSVGG